MFCHYAHVCFKTKKMALHLIEILTTKLSNVLYLKISKVNFIRHWLLWLTNARVLLITSTRLESTIKTGQSWISSLIVYAILYQAVCCVPWAAKVGSPGFDKTNHTPIHAQEKYKLNTYFSSFWKIKFLELYILLTYCHL